METSRFLSQDRRKKYKMSAILYCILLNSKTEENTYVQLKHVRNVNIIVNKYELVQAGPASQRCGLVQNTLNLA